MPAFSPLFDAIIAVITLPPYYADLLLLRCFASILRAPLMLMIV